DLLCDELVNARTRAGRVVGEGLAGADLAPHLVELGDRVLLGRRTLAGQGVLAAAVSLGRVASVAGGSACGGTGGARAGSRGVVVTATGGQRQRGDSRRGEWR